MEQMIWEWVRRDPVRYSCLLDFYRRGARICRADETALVLKNDEINICYAAGPAADHPALRGCFLVLTDDEATVKALTEAGVYREIMPCAQAVYLKAEAPRVSRPGVSLRPLTMEDMDFVLKNYHHPGAYEEHIRRRIAEGMTGAVADGVLAGFAGIHEEGSMGLLEVLPPFRRRGIAEVLESDLIRQQLERGLLPYCHIQPGNDASTALQKKLGLTFDSRTLYWLN